MKVLDRYILQTFIVSLIVVGLAMLGVVLMIHMMIFFDKFFEVTEKTAGEPVGFWTILTQVLTYYFYKSFEYFQLMAAPMLLVAGAASVVRLARDRELTAMKAAGISMYRIMWPMVAVGMVVVGLYVLNQEVIIPAIADRLTLDPDELAGKDNFDVEFVRDEHNNIVYAPIYSPAERAMKSRRRRITTDEGEIGPVYDARVRIIRRDEQGRAAGSIRARKAIWRPDRGGWELIAGEEYPPEGGGLLATPERESVPREFYKTARVTPELLERYRSHDFYQYLGYGELEAVARDPMRGNQKKLMVEMHKHVTEPILILLTLLLGLPVVAGRQERSYFVGIAVSLILMVLVFAVKFTCYSFGETGHIEDPLLAAWIPVFVLLPASVISMETLRT